MSKKVLIVDDEDQDRKGMGIALQREGFSDLQFASSAEEAVNIAKTFIPDVTVIDVVLKGCDGFDVCKQLKALPQIKTKVLIITGHLDAIDVKKARASGADEIIPKVPGFANIAKTIRNLK